ncbi:MAG: Holliday junction resolvase-like protein [Spirochaetales bacterium]|nr:Holliday junction resolvase-like protein [Spirochaetales bacterium]MDY5916298.1 Holliday junction resolvase-like protein [Treponema sp.]
MGIKMIDKALENPRFLLVLIVFLLTLLIIQFFRNQCDKKKLRKDAVKRSKAVINGQVAEQIAPFLPDFPANPSDARFIGKPVDFIVFSGLSENEKIDEILFVEVKTGKSLLSEREKEVKKAIEKGNVRYVEYRIN